MKKENIKIYLTTGLVITVVYIIAHFQGYTKGRNDFIKNPSLALELIAKNNELSPLKREKHLSSICWGLSYVIDQGKEEECSGIFQEYIKLLEKGGR